MNKKPSYILSILLVTVLSACSGNKPVTVDLMDAPEIYQIAEYAPFDTSDEPINLDDLDLRMFYATDRQVSDDLSEWPFYTSERAHVLRLGLADVDMQGGDYTWEQARDITLLKNRSKKYPLIVDSVEEIGVLDSSIGQVEQMWLDAVPDAGPGKAYADAINARLAQSDVKDIYIYTHGYKVYFDNPILVSTELYHFLGYKGAFIAYSWPATPSIWAYSSDLETTRYTSRDFRVLLEFLAAHTDAENIHIIGYSAGTRVVIDAIWDLALLNRDLDDQTLNEKFKIGQVLLMASDYDIDIFMNAMNDRLLEVPDSVSIYLSETDKALGMSSWLLSRRRLGEIDPKEGGLSKEQVSKLNPSQEVHLINVSRAERATSGKGHNYFRQSPWVSSDVLITLRFGLRPGQRGLVQEGEDAVWRFPEDYVARLKDSLDDILGEDGTP